MEEIRTIHPAVLVQIEDGHINFLAKSELLYAIWVRLKLNKSIVGTTRATVSNCKWLNEYFERKLVLVGVGYRSQVRGKELN